MSALVVPLSFRIYTHKEWRREHNRERSREISPDILTLVLLSERRVTSIYISNGLNSLSEFDEPSFLVYTNVVGTHICLLIRISPSLLIITCIYFSLFISAII